MRQYGESDYDYRRRMSLNQQNQAATNVGILLLMVAAVGAIYRLVSGTHRFLYSRFGSKVVVVEILIVISVAVTSLYSAVRSQDENFPNLIAKGERLAAKGEYDAAIATFTRSLQLLPRQPITYNERAWTYHLKGDDAAGLPDANEAVELEPNANNLETRAEIYERLGNRKKAIADYHRSYRLDPSIKATRAGLKRLGIRG